MEHYCISYSACDPLAPLLTLWSFLLRPPPSSSISLACPAVRGWRLQMVEYQQQKEDPRGLTAGGQI